MLSGRNKFGLNLRGDNQCYGLSLRGLESNAYYSKTTMGEVVLSKEYLDFKLQVIKNYIEPLMNKQYEYLKYNYHMIDTTLERIKKYGNEQNKSDIELFTKILKIIRNTIDIHVSFTETEKKLYGIKGVTQLMVRTSRIVLSAKYEVYNNLFGVPEINDGVSNYDDALIDRIDELLSTLSDPTFANIRYEMRDKVSLFLPEQQAEL
tara:strand:- start:431 stop:1048 length:618 start_codon:yes stop_codon:yes gene_type:complete